jgi:hypothetical protein
MKLIYRQTIVEEIRALIAEAVASGRMIDEIEHVAVTQPQWDRLEVECGTMGIPWTETQRIVLFGVPIRRVSCNPG